MTVGRSPFEIVAVLLHRTKITRGPGSRAAGLAMAFKLIEDAEDRWRAVNAPTSSPSCEPVRASNVDFSSNDPSRPRHEQRRANHRHRTPVDGTTRRRGEQRAWQSIVEGRNHAGGDNFIASKASTTTSPTSTSAATPSQRTMPTSASSPAPLRTSHACGADSPPSTGTGRRASTQDVSAPGHYAAVVCNRRALTLVGSGRLAG